MNTAKLLAIALAPLLVTGCYSNSESFWQKAATLSCQSAQECNKASFEAAYSSMDDCIDTISQNGVDLTSTCEYDPKQGRECIKASKKYQGVCDLNASELDELQNACEDTHTDCLGGLGFGFDPEIGQTHITSFEPEQ